MPRVYKSSVAKQKHKPFKGGKKTSQKTPKPIGAILRKKKIKKAQVKSNKKVKITAAQKLKQRKEIKQLEKIQKKLKANSYLDSQSKSRIQNIIKKEVGIKIVVLIPFNDKAEPGQIKNIIARYIRSKIDQEIQEENNLQKQQFNFPYFHFFSHPKAFPGLVKQNFIFIEADRNLQNIADFCKIADIICPILSCKDTNVQGLALNPHENAKAFDDFGYALMNILKHQGMPKIVNLIQHLELYENIRQRQKVQKLFRRYFTSEFGEQQKVLTFNENPDSIFGLLRALQNAPLQPLAFRQNRGYLLAQKVEYDPTTQILEVTGFLKGDCVNANQIVHITGYDDFQIEKIQILKSKSKLERIKSHKNTNQIIQEDQNLVQYSIPNEEYFPFHKLSKENEDNELMNAFEGLTLTKPILQKQQQIEMKEQIEDQQDEISFDEEEFLNFKEEQKKNRMELYMRDKQDLEFQDQAEYPPDINLRQRYVKYQGLVSFKKTQWNSLENLPDEYNKIYVFKNYQKTYKIALQQNKEKGFAYPGFYIKIYIKKFPIKMLEKHDPSAPLILSFLLKHQRKMTMIHLRVKRNPLDNQQDKPIQSKAPYQINFGFRRIYTKPIFSITYNNCDKTKYRKQFKDYDNYYYCSFYYYNTYPPANASIFRIGENGIRQNVPVMYGELLKCDPLHVILKRIILTGYPYKINKRRATVRYMFFNPKDVKYFKPIELTTRLGLRGNIEQSLGTHGLMKCLFNDSIKPHDTVCLYLYKRVFPQATF